MSCAGARESLPTTPLLGSHGYIPSQGCGSLRSDGWAGPVSLVCLSFPLLNQPSGRYPLEQDEL